MDVDANTRNWIIGGVVVIVLLVLGWWLFTKPHAGGLTGRNPIATSTATTSTTVPGAVSATGTASGTVTTGLQGESVQVDDQPAGSSVSIKAMKLSRTTWVAVRDATHVLGARRFDASATSGTIALLRPTTVGQQYMVVMYVDNGDNTFDLHTDMLVTNSSGAPVGDMFTAQ